jgi:hypothetical protein
MDAKNKMKKIAELIYSDKFDKAQRKLARLVAKNF